MLEEVVLKIFPGIGTAGGDAFERWEGNCSTLGGKPLLEYCHFSMMGCLFSLS